MVNVYCYKKIKSTELLPLLPWVQRPSLFLEFLRKRTKVLQRPMNNFATRIKQHGTSPSAPSVKVVSEMPFAFHLMVLHIFEKMRLKFCTASATQAKTESLDTSLKVSR